MRIETFGGWLIGSVLLAVGLAVLASDIDPALLCFKRCDIPKAIGFLFGSGFLRNLTGLIFVLLGLVFLVPLIRNVRSKGQ
jgi:hypothetical protein